MTDLSKTASMYFASSVERKSSTHSSEWVRSGGQTDRPSMLRYKVQEGTYSCGGTSSVFAAVSALFQTWMTKVWPLISEVKIQLVIPDKMRKIPMKGEEIYRDFLLVKDVKK
ncbi:hypothetical protein MKX03_003326 [Papaver bracteatum]|nr:hypothetical protein MKX03_003326 [Papaver bracteatum]